MRPWYSPPDGWAHGLRFLYMTLWSFLSNLCMTIFPHERRRTISRRDRTAFFSRSKMKSVLKTQSERENKTMWNKKSFQRGKLTSMTSTKCSSRYSACPVLKCNQDSEVYNIKNFQVHFSHNGQINYTFKRKFVYLSMFHRCFIHFDL